MENRSLLYSGIVWIVAACALAVYGFMGLLEYRVPGVEELVHWISTIDGWWIVAAAALAMFIEGLYFIGSFVPGSSLVVIIAVLSQAGGWSVFVSTILAILFGWLVAGVCNIVFGLLWRDALRQSVDNDFVIKDRYWATCFPAFRANYEVAQVVSGAGPVKVFLSSLRVKVFGAALTTGIVLVIPWFIDVTTLDNKEGFVTVFVFVAIMLTVGGWQVWSYLKHTKKCIDILE